MERTAIKVILAIVNVGAALLLPFVLLAPETCVSFARYGSYWGLTIAFCCFLWFLAVGIVKRPCFRSIFLNHKIGIVSVVLAGCFLNVHEKKEFKILLDEHTISSTAMNYHFHREATISKLMHRIDDRLVRLESFVDKRPGFYAYVLSLFHSLSGYRVENVFLLNGILTFLLLGLLYYFITTVTNSVYGVFSVFLMTSLPLLAQNTNGGGYEIMNMCMVLTLMISSRLYLRRPGTSGLNLMIMSAVLLSNVRYESILYLVIPVLLVVLKWFREKRVTITWFAVFTPLFALLPLSFNRVFYSNPLFFQTSKSDFFGISYLISNFRVAVFYMFDFSGKYTNSPLISVVGLIAILFLVLYAAKNLKKLIFEDVDLTVFALFSIVVSSITILALSTFWCEWTDPVTSRFSLSLHLLLVIAVPLTLFYGFEFRRISIYYVLIPLFYCVFITSSVSARSIYRPELVSKSGYGWMIDWAKNEINRNDSIVISSAATAFGLNGFATAPIPYFNAIPERILKLKELGVYNHIYVTQFIRFDKLHGGEIDCSGVPVNPRCSLQTVSEKVVRTDYLFRISEVVGLRNASEFEMNTLPENLPPPSPPEGCTTGEYNAYVVSLAFRPVYVK